MWRRFAARGLQHMSAYFALALPAWLCLGACRLCVDVLGFFEKRHEGDLGTHADKQEQKELCHQFKIDDREIN